MFKLRFDDMQNMLSYIESTLRSGSMRSNGETSYARFKCVPCQCWLLFSASSSSLARCSGISNTFQHTDDAIMFTCIQPPFGCISDIHIYSCIYRLDWTKPQNTLCAMLCTITHELLVVYWPPHPFHQFQRLFNYSSPTIIVYVL